MASVKYGAMVTELKGKLGGTVFQAGNVGFVAKNNTYVKGVRSVARNAATNRLVAVTAAWRNLTRVQQLVWSTAAANWPFTDRFGNVYYGSGFQFYTAYAANYFSLNGSYPVAPNAPAASTNPGAITGAYSLAGNLRISWANASVITTGLLFFASRYMSAGKSGHNVPLLFLNTMLSAGATHYDLTLSYPGNFGLPPVGSVIVVRVIARLVTWPIDTYLTDVRIVVTA